MQIAPPPEHAGLWNDVIRVYAKAQAKGSVFKTPTRSLAVTDERSGIIFKLLISGSLQEKTKTSSKLK